MLYPLMAQTEMQGEAEFKCNALGQEIAVAKCLTWFVDHTALERKTSPCYKCKQGQSNRECFAKS